MKRNAKIIASGWYAPEQIVSNQYFNELLGEDVDTWLKEKVQIYNRRWCSPDESSADLAEEAIRQAIENAGLLPEQIDLLIIATDTPEFISPSTASVVQDRLGLKNAGTFDLNTACAGFVTALDVGSKYIQADDQYQYVVVAGVYAMSKYVDLHDKKTVTLFADGAGAVVLSPSEGDAGMIGSKLATDGQYNEWMGIYYGGTKHPVSVEAIENNDHKLKFVKKIPPEINPDMWTKMLTELLNKHGLSANDVNHYFFTQININTIFETLSRLNVPRERAATIMHEYGYTGSACLPMAFGQWMESGKVKKGEIVAFIGSGGGLAFGVSLYKM